ncbi:MAG: DUF885 domain-containing protein [Blastocatellia bacterium]
MTVLLSIALLFAQAGPKPAHARVAHMSVPNTDKQFAELQHSYVVEFLKRFPVVNTYLGGAGFDASLANVDGGLRDHSPSAIQADDHWLRQTEVKVEKISPASLSANARIDRDVMLAQIRFLLHQHEIRRYQERALDTYTDEPFRGVDWQLQGMTQTGDKTYGTAQEWRLTANRVAAIPNFLHVAQDQLLAGIKNKNTPDFRVLKLNGIDTAEADAVYFEKTLPALAAERISGSERDALLKQVGSACQQAAAAYRGLKDFVIKTFFVDPNAEGETAVKPEFRGDRFAFGEKEYDWALKNNLRVNKTAAELYRESWPIVHATQHKMIELAREIGKQHGWKLPDDGPSAVRAVFDQLSKDYPKSDAEMIDWYSQTAFRLVDYARKTGIFDVPADYKLEVTETPPPLRASIDGAAYYPAPPFKTTGVGRFYVTPTGNDVAALQANNRSALADLSAHEGFPGHDWHYKVMTQYRDSISPVRWLTPGAVEDSSSMWEDSMAAEGWALYAESLMAEPERGFPNGAYTPEEHLYQLQGQLYRDLRVRIDAGIHTGRMTYDQAVDLFSEIVDFLPGSCKDAGSASDAKRASCDSAERAIFRYSKWPTQAITYRLGKDEILSLRREATQLVGPKFSEKAFHLLFMKQGTIPAGYFRQELLNELTRQE